VSPQLDGLIKYVHITIYTIVSIIYILRMQQATTCFGHFTVPTVVGSGPAEDGGFLWVIKIRSAHFFRRGSKAVGTVL
jgi:hypothetical protein